MQDEIINRVANSKLVTINLEDYYPQGKRILFDIKDWLFEGFVLREKDFRDQVKQFNWSQFKDNYVALTCSSDAIIPAWAFILLSIHLEPFSKKTVIGNLELLETSIYQDVLNTLDISTSDTQAGTTTTVKDATTTTLKAASTTLPPPAGGVGSSRTAAVTTTTIPAATAPVDPLTGLPEGQTVLPGRKDGLLYLLGPAEATGEVFSNDSSAQVDAGGWVVVAKLRSGAGGSDLWNALSTKCYAGGADCPTKAIAIILD